MALSTSPRFGKSDVERLLRFCRLRYPGKCPRVWAPVLAAAIFLHDLGVGRRLHFSGRVLIRDHRSGVIAQSILRGCSIETKRVRGLRFALRCAARTVAALAQFRSGVNMSRKGLQKFLQAMGHVSALETADATVGEAWSGTLLAADMSPAVQVTGIFSEVSTRPVSLAHLNTGPSWLTGPNAPLFRYSGIFRFADSDIKTDSPTTVTESLCFEEAGLLDDPVRDSCCRILVLPSGESRQRMILHLLIRLISLGPHVAVFLRPHPRRIWAGQMLACLPRVRLHDSRCMSLETSLNDADIALGSAVGAVPRRLEAFRGASHLIWLLDGVNSLALSPVTLDESFAKSMTSTVHHSIPTRRELRELVNAAAPASSDIWIRRAIRPRHFQNDGGIPDRHTSRKRHIAFLQSGQFF